MHPPQSGQRKRRRSFPSSSRSSTAPSSRRVSPRLAPRTLSPMLGTHPTVRTSPGSEPLPPATASTPSDIAGLHPVAEERPSHERRRRRSGSGSSGSSPPTAARVGADLQQLSRLFSRVEFVLQMHLAPLHQQRSALFPRDVGNLLLWAVPAPVPRIESPKVFFIKNKSRLRDCVVVYVNGWSYDMMMCTGAGLRHHAEGSAGEGQAQGKEEGVEEVWDERICNALLRPIRQNRCWARQAAEGSSAGGVQYAPLFIPSVRNTLEQDLFWRNDAPRQARDSSSTSAGGRGAGTSSSSDGSHTTHHSGGGAPQRRAQAPVETDVVDETRVTTPVTEARGAAAAFRRAKMILEGEPSSPTTVSSPTGASGFGPRDAADAQVMAAGVVWQDRALLEQYALWLPRDRPVMDELGFILEAPDGDKSWGSFAEPTPSSLSSSSSSPADAGAAEAPKVYALDCEMVLTGARESQLARATLVNVRTGHVAFDMLVKPRDPVTNYLTNFSGIDEEMLRDVTATLADCQHALRQHIDTATFVVGHSLENDFRACKLLPNCRILDSAWLFPHPSGLPYKNSLRFLAMRYLSKRIQQGSHDSATDALVSAELVQRKLTNGPGFGVRERVSVLGLMVGGAAHASDSGKECVAAEGETSARVGAPDVAEPAAIATTTRTTATTATRTTSSSTSTSNTGLEVSVQLFDEAPVLAAMLPGERASMGHGGRIDAIPVRHDADATRKAVRALERRRLAATQEGGKPDFSLMWVQLRETRDVDVVMRVPRAGETPGAELAQALEAAEEAELAKVDIVNDRVLRIIEACPDETLVIVLAGDCSSSSSGGGVEERPTTGRWSCQNQHSQAQGAAFFFVKDSTAPGPEQWPMKTSGPTSVADEAARSGTPKGDAIDLSSSACQSQ